MAQNLTRFVDAQSGSFDAALSEISSGRKRSHWMWYIFPQLAGLGTSSMSVRYAIKDIDEAKAYARHPVLGPRLKEICSALLALSTNNPTTVMGVPDDLKLKSSMTLFALADPEEKVYNEVIDKFFGGERDALTLALLKGGRSSR
jgi:uncharacterized protein (DUF1810 family)